MIIISHHRSASLAARHLAALRRKYASAKLLSRRNALGRYSSRGTKYVFEVEPKTKAKTKEYVVHFDYGSISKKKGDQRIRFQVHVIGPATAKDADAIDTIRGKAAGKPWPKGWRKRAIFWGKPKKNAALCVYRTDTTGGLTPALGILGGTATPAPQCSLDQKRKK